MQIVRTIVWVLLLVALLLFTAFNWRPVEVKIWEGLILETKIPALVVISFLLGLVPMWMLHKTQTFHYNRRISTPVDPAPDARPVPESEKPRDNLSPEER
jgi:lipopolysaccharide assembly protein A